jgi:hypothetical protein
VDEASKRRWEVGIGFAGSVLTVVGILVGVWQFTQGEQNKVRLESALVLRKDEIEFQRRLWLERLTTYRAVAETAGKIVARIDDPATMKEALREFNAAYWGAMILVEDKAVEKAMVDFFVETQDLQRGWGSTDKLKFRANELIQACRRSAEQGSLKL